MNKKGFTLIELLAVIVLIGAILAISIPNILDLINDKKEKLYDSTVDEIEKVAAQYVATHPDIISDNFTIQISTLCTNKYLSCPISNPKTGNTLDGYVSVIMSSTDVYEYQFVEV
jgi:prepilin-type N-terminal cleavage/methylation domain-containing protein